MKCIQLSVVECRAFLPVTSYTRSFSPHVTVSYVTSLLTFPPPPFSFPKEWHDLANSCRPFRRLVWSVRIIFSYEELQRVSSVSIFAIRARRASTKVRQFVVATSRQGALLV